MPLWSPDEKRRERSLLAAFARPLIEQGVVDSLDYDALWRWSVAQPEPFWAQLWDFSGVLGDRGSVVLDRGRELIDSQFFPDSTLNYAENILRSELKAGIVFFAENGERRELSAAKLREQVSQLQQAMRAMGVGEGDRVAGIMPNCPETIVAMLATTSLGAIWSSCSPDFGAKAIADRFAQIDPKLLFACNGYQYNGKTFAVGDTALALREEIASIEHTVMLEFVDLGQKGADSEAVSDFYQLLSLYQPGQLQYQRVAFNAPLFILFSSGTTGLPKCIVHSVGGTLLQHFKEHQLQSDIQRGDRLLYFTTCGWMMWNWMVSALGSGADLVLYDGSPTWPDAGRLPELVEREGITHFGTSAKFIDALLKQGVTPNERFDFAALRVVFSTGSPLSAAGFEYIYESWKADVCLASIAGGTDIMGCFVGGSPIDPVYAGQCQKRQLGMDVQVFNDEGEALLGEPGELICHSAHPSMPVGFWGDEDRSRYRAAYFEEFPGVWHHGDWVTLTEQGGMVFYGRSDATLNPGGVRIGTAEIYRQVERIGDVLEALVIGQDWQDDMRVVLFVRLRAGTSLDEALQARIKREIRENASPRHVPAKIIAVEDIPRTHSGKITELAVRQVVHGRPVKNKGALANPEALKLFESLPELLD